MTGPPPPPPEVLAALIKNKSELLQLRLAVAAAAFVILSLVVQGCAIGKLDNRVKELEKQSTLTKDN